MKRDSKMVLRQFRGEWKTREPRLRVLRGDANELIEQFDEFEIERVSRVQNSVADSQVERGFG
jgi:ribonuclease HI